MLNISLDNYVNYGDQWALMEETEDDLYGKGHKWQQYIPT